MIYAVFMWAGKMAAATGWRRAEAWFVDAGGGRIEITRPRAMQGLVEKRPGNTGNTYAVSGKLKRLPENHSIWLLIRDERSLKVWPQCSERVSYNADEGTWAGRIFIGSDQTRAIIIAAVVPSTSNDYFNYFCDNGGNTNWAVLRCLPHECSNFHEVTATVT
jgi:hypothetical protein